MSWYAIRDFSNNRKLGWRFLQRFKDDPALGILDTANPEELTPVHKSDGMHYRTVQLTPGYVYLQTDDLTPILDKMRELEHLAKHIPIENITRLNDEDEKRLIEMIRKHKVQHTPTGSLSVGDKITIVHGAFESYIGVIESIGKKKATVVCTVFERSTPIEVDLRHLVKNAD